MTWRHLIGSALKKQKKLNGDHAFWIKRLLQNIFELHRYVHHPNALFIIITNNFARNLAYDTWMESSCNEDQQYESENVQFLLYITNRFKIGFATKLQIAITRSIHHRNSISKVLHDLQSVLYNSHNKICEIVMLELFTFLMTAEELLRVEP